MSFVLGVGLLMPLALVRDKLYVSIPRFVHLLIKLYRTIVLTFLYEGLLIGFWFIDHACVELPNRHDSYFLGTYQDAGRLCAGTAYSSAS